MKRASTILLLEALGLTLLGHFDTAIAQAVQQYQYLPDHIYEVRTGLGITTEIVLSPSEKVLDYSTGFSAGWALTRRANVFYICPDPPDYLIA